MVFLALSRSRIIRYAHLSRLPLLFLDTLPLGATRAAWSLRLAQRGRLPELHAADRRGRGDGASRARRHAHPPRGLLVRAQGKREAVGVYAEL